MTQQVEFTGRDVLYVLSLPSSHELAKIEFADYSESVTSVDPKLGRETLIDKDIQNVTVADLDAELIKRGLVYSWATKRTSEDGKRVQIFLMRSRRKPFPMTDEVRRGVEKILHMTWGWGKVKLKENPTAPNPHGLIRIELTSPQGGRKPKHFLMISNGIMEACEVDQEKRAPRQNTRALENNRHG